MNETNYKEWVRFADMDLDSAKLLFEKMYPPPFEIICYYCQQSAEKNLKALLLFFDKSIIKTHNLVALINELKGTVVLPDDCLRGCAILLPYGVGIRYPQEITISENDVKIAIHHAEIIKSWAMTLFDK